MLGKQRAPLAVKYETIYNKSKKGTAENMVCSKKRVRRIQSGNTNNKQTNKQTLQVEIELGEIIIFTQLDT